MKVSALFDSTGRLNPTSRTLTIRHKRELALRRLFTDKRKTEPYTRDRRTGLILLRECEIE